MRAGLAGLMMILAPEVAFALSCEAYSIRSAYWFHANRAETFVLAQGTFSNLKLVEKVETKNTTEAIEPGRTIYSARFDGFLASQQVFDQSFTAEVTLVFPDFSYIGGGYDTAAAAEGLAGTSGLVWLQETRSGYQVAAELCLPLIDTDPTSVKPALRCLRGGNCPKE